MDALKDGIGGLQQLESRPYLDLAGGSYNYFENGDLLLAKVTPCFENGKKGGGFATSEVFVFRPLPYETYCYLGPTRLN
jgi:type I restriction enzyme, S subunit